MEKQLCPYCGGEMRKGWLRSRRSDIWWEPDPAMSAPDAEKGMRCIAAAGGFTGAEAEAWDCPACKKLVLDRSRRNRGKAASPWCAPFSVQHVGEIHCHDFADIHHRAVLLLLQVEL